MLRLLTKYIIINLLVPASFFKMFENDIEGVHSLICSKIEEFFKNSGKKKAVVGLSGGIDSAVVISLGVKALGRENITAVLMPSPFSTLHSVSDAVELADNLGVKYHIAPIEGIFNKYVKELTAQFGKEPCRLTIENLQARIRGVILMAFANEFDSLLLNTTNKSELAMGYGTMYGDLCGAVMPIADLYKLEVYEMARFINYSQTIIPDSTITKAPSAELSENQKDSDTLPEYHILDPILYAHIEEGKTMDQLANEGFDKETLDRVTKLMRGASFKVHQLPPVIKVSKKPLLPQNKWL